MSDGRKSYAQVLVEERTGRSLPDLLRELYVAKRHTQQEIADALGVGRMTVNAWLREFDITRDDRSAVAL
jgi:DNA-binding XRE family transcriptional regulator